MKENENKIRLNLHKIIKEHIMNKYEVKENDIDNVMKHIGIIIEEFLFYDLDDYCKKIFNKILKEN